MLFQGIRTLPNKFMNFNARLKEGSTIITYQRWHILVPGTMYPTVPGMLAEIIELSSPTSSLEMPKSATCAVMSLSNSTLLGFKSQCNTTS
jgi:hypothetical protein